MHAPIDPLALLPVQLIAERLRCLGHPTRLLIIALLKNQSLTVGVIADRLQMPIASISQHLRALAAHDLVVGERRGRQILYSLHSTVTCEICGLLCRQIEQDLAVVPAQSAAFARLREHLQS